MALEDKLHRAAGCAALSVGVLGLVAAVGAAFGLDPLRDLRFETPPMRFNTALALLCSGAALWCLQRRQFPRAGLALAGVAFTLAAAAIIENFWHISLGIDQLFVSDKFGDSAVRPPGRMSQHNAFAIAVGALAVAALAQRRDRNRWPLSAWLASAVVAVGVASLLAQGFQSVTNISRPLRLGTHTSLSLLILAVGTLLARPEDKFIRLMFARGSTGVLSRRLFFGAAVVPLILSTILIELLRRQLMGLGDGVILLTVGLAMCGFVIALFSSGVAVSIDEHREESEQARLLLTARLQEQAAHLQETVSLRTRELREANAELRATAESNALLALVAEHTTNGVAIADSSGHVEWVNAAFTRITGYTLEEMKGKKPGYILPGLATDRATVARLEEAVQQAKPCVAEVLNYAKDGRPFWFALDVQPVLDRAGRVINFIALGTDVTEERNAQHGLENLNERLALATHSAALGVWEWDAVNDLSQWDARTLEIYGLSADEYHGKTEDWFARIHPEDRGRAKKAAQSALAGQNTFEHQFRIIRGHDGAVRHIQSRGIAQRDAQGRLLRIIGTDLDITAERESAQQLEVLNERLRLALRSSNYGVWELDPATETILWDEQMYAIYGLSRGEFDGARAKWREYLHPEDRTHAVDVQRRVTSGETPNYDTEFRIVRPDGEIRYIEAHGYLQRDSEGRALRLVGLNRDITERRQLEERVRKSEELATQVSDLALIGGWEYDVETDHLMWTEGVRRIHEVDERFEPTIENTQHFYPPESRAILQAALSGNDPSVATFDHELPLITARGQHRWVRLLGRTEFREDGQPIRVHGAIQDVTARHASEESRRELETQLFQAQKMETLGTLAGGIAHDFNNLLTGIIGYHELAADSLAEDHPARMCLTEARNASLRARELVEQILTFGRQSPGGGHVPLELAPVIEEARRFLRATLPATINLELHLAPHCPPVLGDATQIHQVLLNLGSNAAHAMRHHGGTLTIVLEPAEVTPDLAHMLGGPTAGSYVRLSVSDTGHGMDEATRRRIFDPFFTTKNTREGTGLGLAVVHGIVRAHRGAIDVESVPGAGSTFHIYLPAAAAENEQASEPEGSAPPGVGESVWVVDDEEVVASCTKLVLEGRGYTVAVFNSAEACLSAMSDGTSSCAVLVTDQTMPGMQGTELIAALRRTVPGLPVVIMSGYFSKISPYELDELGQVELLAKPFTTDELTHSVHRALHPSAAPS